MVFGSKQTNYEAVLFLSRKKVLKEMLYSEFEAVLDGVVSEPEFKGETCHAVFLKIDMRLNILGAVFFVISFDDEGSADRRWNLPLSLMAETAPASHQVNGSEVRVACRSQCQVPAHQEYLWEPDLTADGSTLPMLASSIKTNRLGLLVDPSITDVPDTQPDSIASNEGSGLAPAQMATGANYQKVVDQQAQHDEHAQKMAANLKKQQLYITSLKTRSERELESLRAQFAREKEALMLQLEEACSTLKSATTLNQKLEQELHGLHEGNEQQREFFENQLSASNNQQGVDFFALQKQFRRELQEKLLEQTSELKARLEMRDVEAHYRDEQIKSLKQQLANARSGDAQANNVDLDRVWHDAIVQLEGQGVNFMLALPAMRPLSIPAVDLSSFSAQPEDYVAARLGMEPALYQAWIEHARNPVCVEQITEDCHCGSRLEIARPAEFIPDVSDRCSDHRNGIVEKLKVNH